MTSPLVLPPELLINAEQFAVYRCYSGDGALLYIGSGQLSRRLSEHAKKTWFLHVRGITLEWYADELDARNAERRAIHVEHPKYNVQHRNGKISNGSSRRRRKSRRSINRPAGETRALALVILADEPGISGQELGRRLGTSESYGCRLKNKLAPVTGPED